MVAVDDVEQFAELNGEADRPIGRDVAAVARDDQGLVGGEHCIEEQIASFGVTVALADTRPHGEQVVAVDARLGAG